LDKTLKVINSCEVCGNSSLVDVINLGLNPLCDDLIKIGEPITCRQYPIEIVFCDFCNTAHQRYQVPKEILFNEDYHYRSRVTSDVILGMQSLVDSYIQSNGSLIGLKVLDVGCNDGSLLNLFKEKGAKTYGVEPTGAAKEAMKNHMVIQDFFDDKIAKILSTKFKYFDIITFSNVFAHIEDLDSLIRNTSKLMSETTTLIIENHYLGSVLKKGQFDTFYHEHPRSYSLNSFKEIANKLKGNIYKYEYPSRYGGNIRVFISRKKIFNKLLYENIDYLQLFNQVNIDMKKWIKLKKIELEKYFKKFGKLPAKAFPGRAVILIKLLGLTEENISAVYEIKGSIKTGFYVPGTRIPILPESELYAQEEQKPIINLAWHISDAVRENLRRNNYNSEIIDIK
tara:strand:- start:344 stop:1534 length:1191 start_codon:yes stop_codon:yes gene_type:complete